MKIIALIGPTASGKTDYALKLARLFNGELLNTDSRQIYKYLDIGTAKGSIQGSDKDGYTLEGIPIHLINLVNPDETLTLAQYQKIATETIDEVVSRGKLPILVGGTGLYIDAIIKGYTIPQVAPDRVL